MLNRKIDNDIDAHFSNSKKALFLTGARQVGKTYLSENMLNGMA